MKEDVQPKQPFNPEQEKEDYKKFNVPLKKCNHIEFFD